MPADVRQQSEPEVGADAATHEGAAVEGEVFLPARVSRAERGLRRELVRRHRRRDLHLRAQLRNRRVLAAGGIQAERVRLSLPVGRRHHAARHVVVRRV